MRYTELPAGTVASITRKVGPHQSTIAYIDGELCKLATEARSGPDGYVVAYKDAATGLEMETRTGAVAIVQFDGAWSSAHEHPARWPMEEPMKPEVHPVPPVSGYRPLSQEQVDLMNEGKAVFNAVGAYLDKLGSYTPCPAPSPSDDPAKFTTDGRCVSIARTEAQTAAMWAMRAITKPGGFA
jgi:hypothetical protein